MTKQREYKIPIDVKSYQRYLIDPHWHGFDVHSPFRQASIAAVEDKLISAYASLLHETSRCDGYPGSTVAACNYLVEGALLLLSEVRQLLRDGKRSSQSIVGTSEPHAALESLARTRREMLDRHLIKSAEKGSTDWFTVEHWARLSKIAPHLVPSPLPAPADAGEP